jgi:D-alanine-D-alanine ligase
MAGTLGRAPRKIAVLMGGPSVEREVSLSSGRECAAALRPEGFDVVEIDAGPSLPQDLAEVAPDVAFNALHGRWGEDGCVQGLLEWLRVPYTHSGVLASALAMDKTRAKAAFASVGLLVPESRMASAEDVSRRHVMEPPYVVKPNAEGSSVGIYIVDAVANGPPVLEPGLPASLMVERYVTGRELTVTVVGDRPLCVTDIQTDGWYDYDAKYRPGGSRHVVPADIPAAISELCREQALEAHRALGCRGVTRTDFRWDEDLGPAGLFVLELNTQPGMTPTSLVPEQAAAEAMSFGDLCRWIVEDASCDR